MLWHPFFVIHIGTYIFQVKQTASDLKIDALKAISPVFFYIFFEGFPASLWQVWADGIFVTLATMGTHNLHF